MWCTRAWVHRCNSSRAVSSSNICPMLATTLLIARHWVVADLVCWMFCRRQVSHRRVFLVTQWLVILNNLNWRTYSSWVARWLWRPVWSRGNRSQRSTGIWSWTDPRPWTPSQSALECLSTRARLLCSLVQRCHRKCCAHPTQIWRKFRGECTWHLLRYLPHWWAEWFVCPSVKIYRRVSNSRYIVIMWRTSLRWFVGLLRVLFWRSLQRCQWSLEWCQCQQ